MIITTVARGGIPLRVERIHIKLGGYEFLDFGGEYIDVTRPGQTRPDAVINRRHGDGTSLPFEPLAVGQRVQEYVTNQE